MKLHKIIHRRKDCIGCNMCVALAPQTWEIDEVDGKSNLIAARHKGDLYIADVFECDLEANKTAADACPMKVIEIRE